MTLKVHSLTPQYTHNSRLVHIRKIRCNSSTPSFCQIVLSPCRCTDDAMRGRRARLPHCSTPTLTAKNANATLRGLRSVLPEYTPTSASRHSATMTTTPRSRDTHSSSPRRQNFLLRLSTAPAKLPQFREATTRQSQQYIAPSLCNSIFTTKSLGASFSRCAPRRDDTRRARSERETLDTRQRNPNNSLPRCSNNFVNPAHTRLLARSQYIQQNPIISGRLPRTL